MILKARSFPRRQFRCIVLPPALSFAGWPIGGREGRDNEALQLAQTCEKLGVGEILLNCIDKAGINSGFDIELINYIRDNVTILIASSGAGKVEHFSGVFEKTKAEAALTAGIFHREEVPIEAVKEAYEGARNRDALNIDTISPQ